jgi:ribosome-associated heat shock protein Hsp15
MAEGSMRLDKFLWFARLTKTRGWAQDIAHGGHLRIDGRRIEKAAAPVRPGNVVAFITHDHQVRIIRVEALPARRGPAPEARLCYTDLKNENVSQKAPID